MQENTLALIRTGLRAAPPQGLTSDALARQTGLSAVTVRRYLNYLSTINYDTGGRPCRLYHIPGVF